jgi:hypothetical protein
MRYVFDQSRERRPSGTGDDRMSDKPKPGDRVRVTYEGTATLHADMIEIGFDSQYALIPSTAVVEVLPPPEPPEVLAVRETWPRAYGDASLEEVASEGCYPASAGVAKAVLALIDAYTTVVDRQQRRTIPERPAAPEPVLKGG